MSTPVVFAELHASIDDCAQLMERNMIRRLPVADDQGYCRGILSQADIALCSDGQVEEIVKQVSRPTSKASNVTG
jgi:CBS-domain-containing membrane protein